MSEEEAKGTFKCPVCGLDTPHHHPANTPRWAAEHIRRFFDACETVWPLGASHEWRAAGDGILFYNVEVRRMWVAYCAGVDAAR